MFNAKFFDKKKNLRRWSFTDEQRVKDVLKRSPHGIRVSTLCKLINITAEDVKLYLSAMEFSGLVKKVKIKDSDVYFWIAKS